MTLPRWLFTTGPSELPLAACSGLVIKTSGHEPTFEEARLSLAMSQKTPVLSIPDGQEQTGRP